MIAITGATGKLGHLVIKGITDRIGASGIVACVRDKQKAKDLEALGVELRQADYSQPETLRSAFAGAEKVLLISSSEIEGRVAQHQAVIDASKAAAVKLLAYTSILRAESSPLALAADHKITEQSIKTSGVPYVLLRNGWYLENQTEQLGPAVEHGAILGAAGQGRFASASRSDYAAAAVAVLTGSGHENKIYELAGDNSYTLSELAEEVTKQAGRPVSYRDLPPADYEKALTGFGLPPDLAHLLADADLGAAKGALDSSFADLRSLIGRPTTSLAAAVTAGLSIRK